MKKQIAFVLAGVLALTLAGCGSSNSNNSSNSNTDQETVTLKVGASPTPHAEILYAAQDLLAEKGITLEVVEFVDYVQPNQALEDGELDANYFQHGPYLEWFNEEYGTHLEELCKVHYEPMGIYSTKITDLADLPDGAKVGIPNDGTNGARALLLLESAGLITLDPEAGIAATKLDIKENPKNLEIVEAEAAQLPLSIDDLDIAVINGNYALQGGFNVTEDALVMEDAESVAAKTYANIVAVKEGASSEALDALVEVLHSEEIQNYINETYQGAVAPIQ